MGDFVPNDWASGEVFDAQHVDAIELELDEQEGVDTLQNTFINLRPGGWTSGQYYFMNSPQSVSTSNALGFGNLRVCPALIPQTVAINRLAWDVATVGDPAATFRPCIYGDDGTGKPGPLIVEGGDVVLGTAGQFESTVSVTLNPGLYWAGGVVRGTGTQPTMRTCNPGSVIAMFLPQGSSLSANLSAGIFSQVRGSIAAGALPNPFSINTPSGTSAVRLAFRVA